MITIAWIVYTSSWCPWVSAETIKNSASSRLSVERSLPLSENAPPRQCTSKVTWHSKCDATYAHSGNAFPIYRRTMSLRRRTKWSRYWYPIKGRFYEQKHVIYSSSHLSDGRTSFHNECCSAAQVLQVAVDTKFEIHFFYISAWILLLVFLFGHVDLKLL